MIVLNIRTLNGLINSLDCSEPIYFRSKLKNLMKCMVLLPDMPELQPMIKQVSLGVTIYLGTLLTFLKSLAKKYAHVDIA